MLQSKKLVAFYTGIRKTIIQQQEISKGVEFLELNIKVLW